MLNLIIRAIFNEAQWLLEMGVASVEDIDNACMYGQKTGKGWYDHSENK